MNNCRTLYRNELAVILVIVQLLQVAPSMPCTTHDECEGAYRKGSECVDSLCSNPFSKGGCLYNMKEGWNKLRVCHSEDSPDAVEKGYCREAENDYMEIRIMSQNWESVFFETWILQIILSEILDVPVTIETGTPDAKLNFYDEDLPFDYGSANDWDALRLSNEIGDCRKADKSSENYQSCAHLVPEVWNGHLETTVKDLQLEGIVEQPQGLGALGQQSWFIPTFTAKRDPTLLTYFGLAGQENRRKLAERFLRPTTWREYCDLVSPTNCTGKDDPVAKRAPQDETEEMRLFVADTYTGHFRKTEKNDCDKWPHNCTGHIADFPCMYETV